MKIVRSVAGSLLILAVAGCELIEKKESASQLNSETQADYTDSNTSQLDRLNARARGEKSWFADVLDERERLMKRFDGELPPRLAAYLESNIYVYEDADLQSYLVAIKDRLLNSWEGPPLDIDIVVESDTRFNAYVDATSQLHVSTGLLDSLENEDELAAVLAHELAHLLYRHTTSRAGYERFGSLIEAVGSSAITIAADKRINREEGIRAVRRLTKSGQGLGLLWTDFLVPKRSRNFESEADRLGLDLLVRAGYNASVFDNVLARIQNAARVRSERVALIEELVREKLGEGRSKLSNEVGADNAADLSKITGSLLDGALGFVDNQSKRYADTSARISELASYRDRVYHEDELPPPVTEEPYLVAIGKSGGRSTLQADLESIRSVIALAEKDRRTAARLVESVSENVGEVVDVLSINLARASLEIANERHAEARSRLEELIKDEQAPVEAYLRLARLQSFQRDFEPALETLDTGVRRIGRDYRFLPTRIYIEKQAGKQEMASISARACARYDAGATRLTLEMLAGVARDPESYYADCVAILGSDPIAKQLEQKRSKAEDIVGGACEIMAKLGLGKCE